MGSYDQLNHETDNDRAREPSRVAELAPSAKAALAAPHGSLAAALNRTAASQRLLQLRRDLDGSPRVQALAIRTRALNPRADAGTSRISTGPVIQRASVEFGVSSHGKKRIDFIKIDRVEVTNFRGAGDHGTAHIVLRHWAENVLLSATIDNVGAVLDGMVATVESMPAYGRQVSDERQAAINQLRQRVLLSIAIWKTLAGNPSTTDAVLEHILIDAVNNLINWRNNLPLSAIEFGGTGHGEGTAANFLDQLNFRLSPNGSGVPITKEEADKAIGHIKTLFDIKAFSEFTSDEDKNEMLDQESMHGFGPGAFKLAVDQHIATVSAAYPYLWAALKRRQAAGRFRKSADAGETKQDLNWKPGDE
jgi:hypothetical protein